MGCDEQNHPASYHLIQAPCVQLTAHPVEPWHWYKVHRICCINHKPFTKWLDAEPPCFNLYWESYCYVQQCGAFVCLCECVQPTHVDREKHKHMCVAMAPTTTVTSKPICYVTMVTVISQRVGGRERQRERWDSNKKREGMGHITTRLQRSRPCSPITLCVYTSIHVTTSAVRHLFWTSCINAI